MAKNKVLKITWLILAILTITFLITGCAGWLTGSDLTSAQATGTAYWTTATFGAEVFLTQIAPTPAPVGQ